MSPGITKIYDKIVGQIGDESSKMSRDDYEDFIAELAAHLKCIQDCIDEENEA